MGSLALSLKRAAIYSGVIASVIFQSAAAQTFGIPTAPKRGTVTVEDNWTPKERDFFWRKTTVDPEGFLRIAGTADQVNIVEEARSQNYFRPKVEPGFESVVSRIAQAGFPFVGSWKEDEFRTTMLFGNASTGFLMYTLFNFAKQGSSVTVAKDFARFEIKGSPAVLTLTVSPDGTKGLWKVTTWRSGVTHEIYLNEEVSYRDKKPKRNLGQILRIANSIIN